MPLNDTPFNTKIKLECECAACESKYKIIYFEDEVPGEIRVCPFCSEPTEEYSEQTEAGSAGDIKEEILYTDDDDALYKDDIIDDDDNDTTPTDNDDDE